MTNAALGSYRGDVAMTLSLVLSALAFVVSLFNYFWTGNGIHGTEGALLVVVSTLLLTLATGVVFNRWGAGWLRIVLEVLIGLDFLGTIAAAYLLQAWILVALVILAALPWLAHLVRRPHPSLAMQG
jgi:quinoprotein glucose dehydrogenase